MLLEARFDGGLAGLTDLAAVGQPVHAPSRLPYRQTLPPQRKIRIITNIPTGGVPFTVTAKR